MESEKEVARLKTSCWLCYQKQLFRSLLSCQRRSWRASDGFFNSFFCTDITTFYVNRDIDKPIFTQIPIKKSPDYYTFLPTSPTITLAPRRRIIMIMVSCFRAILCFFIIKEKLVM